MKPFNLQAALAGAPVVTRDGEPAEQLTLFDAPNEDFPLVGVVSGRIRTWTRSGKRMLADVDNEFDLFMASTKRVVWVNLYPKGEAYYYTTKRIAEAHPPPDRIGGKAWPLEIEE